MDLLVDVLDTFKKIGFLINLSLSMGIFFLCGCNGKNNIKWDQWLKPQARLKSVVASRAMKGSIVAMLNIRKAFNTCVWMFGVINYQNMKNHYVDHLCFSINL